ncbi:nucleotidyl transferase AbiEii/AbiGii toxin family protein [Phycisphaera mikurensis]|uniref:Nucleotidyl transferase AbiEii/AbiGii toxin family protein n=1 Tax=Phycisphaera mikurensis (strain NBRC 102666 / KCTC 22515 / FYK2301M01) TaxID=1142394 RepID=I0IJC5_PHYMF|nr:nucleotidyl transferase AbiEii/AbiGii toxin family protein [Phycisphaera mikurensis]MBB6443193.1 hypothetical protein [Phycisphaera mikurensis]BAM05363.1 hypothetical protein PSMK_p00010 [Phycisphaera mikurensis NBRC 102666]
MKAAYERQVDLLLRVAPTVAAEACFALKGGTAINLFRRDMPRLSIDLDLTYLPRKPREAALAEIVGALHRVAGRLDPLGIRATVQRAECKLLARTRDAVVKVEVSKMMRGSLFPPEERVLCASAQERFGRFVAMPVVNEAEVFAGKLVAALDRQHPRDLFDTRFILDRLAAEGAGDELRVAFLAAVLSSSRPPDEILDPRIQDPGPAFERAFAGMARDPFSVKDHARTLENLRDTLPDLLRNRERAALLGFVRLRAEAGSPPLAEVMELPAVRWKRVNLERLRKDDAERWRQAVGKVEAVLNVLRDRGRGGR